MPKFRIYSRGNWDKELNVLNVFAIIISNKISIQIIKLKRTANCKIKEKINNSLIQKTGIKP